MFRKKDVSDIANVFIIDIGTIYIKILACRIEARHVIIVDQTTIPQRRKNIDLYGNILSAKGISGIIEKWLKEITPNFTSKKCIVTCNHTSFITDYIYFTHSRKKPESPIKTSEIREVFESVQSLSFERVEKNIEQQGSFFYDPQILTSCVDFLGVDDTSEKNIIGKTGEKIKTGVLNIFCSRSFYEDIKEIIRYCDLGIISIVPSTFLLLSKQEKNNDYTLSINIGHNFTTAYIKNKKRFYIFSIPIGTRGIRELLYSRKNLHIFSAQNIIARPEEYSKGYEELFIEWFKNIFEWIQMEKEKQWILFIKKFYMSGRIFTPKTKKLFEQVAQDFFPGIQLEFQEKEAFSYGQNSSIFFKKNDPILKILKSVLPNHG